MRYRAATSWTLRVATRRSRLFCSASARSAWRRGSPKNSRQPRSDTGPVVAGAAVAEAPAAGGGAGQPEAAGEAGRSYLGAIVQAASSVAEARTGKIARLV